MSSTYIDSEMLPIGKFLSNATAIQVPPFQRSYAWTDEEVRQLWTDITEAMDSKQAEYFLGPMVLKKSKDRFEIIDGQQRITTVLIILSAIRRAFRQEGEDQRADWFRNKYFGEQDVDTLETEPKFHMNEENDPIFQRFVRADTDEKTVKDQMKGLLKKDTNYLLLQAVTILWECVQKRQKDLSEQTYDKEVLLQIHKYLQDQIFVLLLKVKDEADAYVIFETLNDRGRGLNTMDLLKNHVFGKGKNHLDQIKMHWIIIKDNLADVDPGQRFLYHYWTSLHGRTSRNNLFRLMREKITDATSALKFANELSNAAKLYAALSIPGHPNWNNYDQRTRENLETLKLLDAQQALPILLAAADSFSEEEFSKLTQVLVVMAVRYNLIGELRTGVAANHYSDIPPKIRSRKILKSAKVFRELRPIYPSDEAFQTAFTAKVLKNAPKARYLLGEIEKYLQEGKSAASSDPQKVNLEHILPKNASSPWKETLSTLEPDEVDDFVSRLGNLALVSTAVNKKIGAKGFDAKKELFETEQYFKFTKLIASYDEWTKNTIINRQAELANVAVGVWKIEID